MSGDLWCAPHIFMTRVAEDVVVLDAAAGQYHCLLDLSAQLAPATDGRLGDSPANLAAALIEANLATWSAPPARIIGPPAACVAQPGEAFWPRAALAAASLATSSLAFRRQDFAALLRPAPVRSSALRPRLPEILRAAADVLPWLPGEGACLQRAYQLRRLLAAHGFETTWMFGVRTWPFAAHCWIQIGDCVIADRLERIRRYTPIMAV